MSPREPHAYVIDALAAARAIERFVDGRSWTDYQENDLLRAGVERKFLIVGEALDQLSRVAPDLAEAIVDLPRIVAFSNVLAHGYAMVRDELVWQTAHRQVPALIAALAPMVEEDR